MTDKLADQPSPYLRRAGRPGKLTAKMVADASNFARSGAMNADIAALCGISLGSYQRWMAQGRHESERRFNGEDPDRDADLLVELFENIRQTHATIVATLSTSWLTAAQGDWKAAQALLGARFHHWRPSHLDPAGPAIGSGSVDDAADLAEAELSDAQARAIVGAMHRFGEALMDVIDAAGVDEGRARMGQLARQALLG